VGYVTDAEGDFVVSTKAYTAEWRNVLSRPEVNLTVVDGPAHLAIAGTAEASKSIRSDPMPAKRGRTWQTASVRSILRIG